jgi:hypothetical protein
VRLAGDEAEPGLGKAPALALTRKGVGAHAWVEGQQGEEGRIITRLCGPRRGDARAAAFLPAPQSFGESGWSSLVCFGKTVAVLALDSRRERTVQQIVTKATWAECVRGGGVGGSGGGGAHGCVRR